jgi:hypothetical protein
MYRRKCGIHPRSNLIIVGMALISHRSIRYCSLAISARNTQGTNRLPLPC